MILAVLLKYIIIVVALVTIKYRLDNIPVYPGRDFQSFGYFPPTYLSLYIPSCHRGIYILTKIANSSFALVNPYLWQLNPTNLSRDREGMIIYQRRPVYCRSFRYSAPIQWKSTNQP